MSKEGGGEEEGDVEADKASLSDILNATNLPVGPSSESNESNEMPTSLIFSCSIASISRQKEGHLDDKKCVSESIDDVDEGGREPVMASLPSLSVPSSELAVTDKKSNKDALLRRCCCVVREGVEAAGPESRPGYSSSNETHHPPLAASQASSSRALLRRLLTSVEKESDCIAHERFISVRPLDFVFEANFVRALTPQPP